MGGYFLLLLRFHSYIYLENSSKDTQLNFPPFFASDAFL